MLIKVLLEFLDVAKAVYVPVHYKKIRLQITKNGASEKVPKLEKKKRL